MKCSKCNAEIGDGKKFCTRCGAKLNERKKHTLVWIFAVIFGLVLAGGGGYGVVQMLHRQQQEQRYEKLMTMIEGSPSVERWLKSEEKKLMVHPLTEEEQDAVGVKVRALKNLDSEDYLGQIELVEEMKTLSAAIDGRLSEDASQKLEELKALDPGYASENQKTQMASYAADMLQMIEKKEYTKAQELAETWTVYAQEAAQKKTGYTVRVMQYDFNEFPKVKMYLDVRDSAGGVVKELSPNMFYVSERDAGNGDFLARTVDKAVIMNENERLNINLLADTSGSMEGQNLLSAKAIMKNFLNTVQFNAGDQVKLTQFNSIIDKSTFFTGDISSLNSLIDSYVANGQTKLYDAIVYGVQDATGQEGARCVLAFTDGQDVGSFNSASDVVDVVSRYRVPVFIVRIGDYSGQNDTELRRIAEASGGSFKNLQQFSADMTEFYNQIYRQMKEYYVVEFESGDMTDMTNTKEYDIYIQNDEVGGEAVGTAEPGTELFDSLLGAYLRSYILDMNNHHYNYLTQYVDSAVDVNDQRSIQWQMKKQVSGGFNNVAMETLMSYQISSIEVTDANTVRLKTIEDYDVVYDEVFSDIQAGVKNIHHQQLAYMNTRGVNTQYLLPDTQVRIWARVRQFPEYIIRRGFDGKWRFSQYGGDLNLNLQRDFYDVEIYSYGYY